MVAIILLFLGLLYLFLTTWTALGWVFLILGVVVSLSRPVMSRYRRR